MDPFTSSTQQWAWGLAYALFSSSLLVVNKWALTHLATPNLLMLLQATSTVGLIYLIGVVQHRRFRREFPDGTPFATQSTLAWFIACTLLQFVTIGSNMMAVYHLGVDRLILIRVVAMIPIAFGDWLFNERRLPSVGSWLCFTTLIIAAVFVFGHDSEGVGWAGILWGGVYMGCITTDQIVLKMFTRAVKMNDSDRALWVNLFTMPIALCAIFASGETGVMSGTHVSFAGVSVIALSCILGAGISYTAWGYRSRVTAVTFSLVGVMCKIGSMGLNFALLPHVSPWSILLISLGIVSTYFYEQAPARGDEDMRARMPKKRALLILLLVFAFGAVNVLQKNCVWDGEGCVQVRNETLPLADTGYPTEAPSCSFPVLVPPPPTTSWHRCVGRTAGSAPWRLKSCHFKAVCYNGNLDGELTYFAHPLEKVEPADLSSGTMVPYVGSDPRSKVREYKVRVVRERIPKEASWPHRDSVDPIVLVPANYFLPGVWTHLVFDNLLPTYRLMELFGLDVTRVRAEPHWLQYPCDNPGYHDGCDMSDRRFNPKWIELMGVVGTRFTQFQQAYNVTPGQWTCFDNVVTGLSLFTDHGEGWSGHGRDLNQPVWTNFGSSPSWWGFRVWTLERARAPSMEREEPLYAGPFYDVLFLRKGNSTWDNNGIDTGPIATALVSHLHDTDDIFLKNYTIAPVVYLEKYSLEAQMALVSRAKVIVSQVGSTSFGAFWLPKGATLILLHANEPLDFYFWDNIAWMETVFVHYQGTQEAKTEKVLGLILSGLRSV